MVQAAARLIVCVVVMVVAVSIPTPVLAERVSSSRPDVRTLASFVARSQDDRTGLFESFPESRDTRLRQVAFTYDVAVAAIVLTHQGNLTAASNALQAFRRMRPADRQDHAFNTAYHTKTARPTLEYRTHGGPLFWMAIALMRHGEAASRPSDIQKGIKLLEWVKDEWNHFSGGVVMGLEEPWAYLTSVENNWVYYAALRTALSHLPEGSRRQALHQEARQVRQWIERHACSRGDGDNVKALDVYTHALLVGSEAHLEDAFAQDRDRLASWARAWIQELDALFQVPGTARYDYTDANEARLVGRARAGWLEGTEQVAVAYLTWAEFFEAVGDREFADQLRQQAACSHEEVLAFALLDAQEGMAIPNTDAPRPFQTFMEGWMARPRNEFALNSTNWAYLAEAGYNPFTTRIPPLTISRSAE